MMRRTLSWLSAAVLLGACATLGGEDGGSDGLPTRGITGWQLTGSETSPYLFASTDALAYSEPAALALDGKLYLFMTESSSEGSRVLVAESADGLTFGSAREVLKGFSAAQVISHPQGHLWLVALDADKRPHLFKATSVTGSFEPQTVDGLLDEAYASPSVVLSPDGSELSLYWLREGALVVQSSPLSQLRFSAPNTQLGAGTDCVDLNGESAPCWDKDGLRDAEVRLSTSILGRTLHRTFFVGSNTQLGFAASESEVLQFHRYAENPVFQTSPRLASSSATRFSERYHLYYGVNNASGRSLGIAHALSPEGQVPSEQF